MPRSRPKAATATTEAEVAETPSKTRSGKASAASSAPFQVKLKPTSTPEKAKPALGRKKPGASTKSKKVSDGKQGKSESPKKVISEEFVLSDEDNDSDDFQEETKKSTSVLNKSSPGSSKKLKGSPGKSPAKAAQSPKKIGAIYSDESDSDDQVAQSLRKSAAIVGSSKLNSRPKPDSESEDDSDSEPDTGRKSQSNSQPSPNFVARKNLSSELSKARPASGLISDSEGETTFESMDEDEDELKQNKPKAKSIDPAKVEAKEGLDEIIEGEKIVSAMSDDDLIQLVERLVSASPVLDAMPVVRRTRLFKWDSVAFNEWDAEACRKAWAYLHYKRRLRRNAWEILNEIKIIMDKSLWEFRRKALEKSPAFPKKPPGITSGLSMYAHVKYASAKDTVDDYMTWYKTIVQEFKELPESEQKYWKGKAEAAAAEYREAIEEYYAKIPGAGLEVKPRRTKTKPKAERKKSPPKVPKAKQFEDAPNPPDNPLECFIQSKLNKLSEPPLPAEKAELRSKFGRDYHNLKDSKKVKWIGKVIKGIVDYNSAVEEYKKVHPTFQAKSLRALLAKGEISLWEASQGKPEKPPSTPGEGYEKELEQNGELAACASDAERKALVDAKWNKLNFYDQEMYKLKQRQQELDYFKAMSEYITTLPDFLRPTIISMLEPKCKRYVTSGDVLLPKSPRKRKRDGPSEEHSSKPKKSKTKKKAPGLDVQEALNNVEEARQELHEGPPAPVLGTDPPLESLGKKAKKKKNKHPLDEVIRGIFDAVQTLGRQYSAFYYYGLYAAKTEPWIAKIHSLGVYKTARLITQDFLDLEESKKIVYVTHSYDRHMQKYYGAKPETITDFKYDDLSIATRYPGEPAPPPKTAKELYQAEVNTLRQSGSVDYKTKWNELDEDTQQLYMIKLYSSTKEYVAMFEEFVGKMTPWDIIDYSVCKANWWEKNLKTDVLSQSPKKEFSVPLPTNDVSDDDDYAQPEIVSRDEIHDVRLEMNNHVKGKRPRFINVFNTNNFLEKVCGSVDKNITEQIKTKDTFDWNQ